MDFGRQFRRGNAPPVLILAVVSLFLVTLSTIALASSSNNTNAGKQDPVGKPELYLL